jgi:tetratricopeptide (TPR) repeat protein
MRPSGAIAAILVMWLAPAVPGQPRPAVADSSLTTASRALSAGDTDRAFALATNYLKRHPASAQAKVLLVRIHIERGEWDGAYRVASRAARAHPADVEVLYHLGLVTRRLASDEFQRLGDEAPGSARVHQLKAEVLEAQGRRDEAEKEYASALDAQPDLLDALLGLAKLKRIRLECEEAIQLNDKAESIQPTFDAAYGLGVCQSYLENHEEAVKTFGDAVKRSPSAAVAWTGLGSSLVKLRRTAEGIAKLQHAIALEPAMYEAHYALGMAYRASGDTVRAQNAFKKAEQLLGPR